MCGGVACKLGCQASAISMISKVSLLADHPPMCLKMLCKCTIIQYCNASLCKEVRHYFRHYFVLFTFNSKLSFLFHYVNLPKGKVLVNLCVSTLINWGRVTHICVGNPTIIGWSAPSHYLNRCWNIVNWTPKNRFQWNLNQKSQIFIQENLFENVVRKMAAILSWPPCVNTLRPSDAYIHPCFMSSFI